MRGQDGLQNFSYLPKTPYLHWNDVFHQLQNSQLSTDAEQSWIFVIRTPSAISEDRILHGNSPIPACCHPNSTLGNHSRVDPHF